MKKFKSHFQLVFVIAFVSLSTLSEVYAQSIHHNSPSPGEYEFSINNLPVDVTNAFWILGDGHFRTGLAPTHYLKNDTNNLVQAYLLEPYRVTPPTKLTCGNCSDDGTSSQANFQVLMGSNQSVKVGTSWNPTRGQKHYTILTFTNVNNLFDGRVRIQFLNNVSSVQVNVVDNSSTWFNLSSNSNNEIRFMFTGLQLNEQRHVLIETEVLPSPLGGQINYFVEMTNLLGDIYYQATQSTEIGRYPHDPNDKVVSEDEICAHNNEEVTLEYRIDFQNEGENFAETVVIKDWLPDHLDYSSLQVISSSDTYQIYQNSNYLEFTFPEIFLPGLDQTLPNIPHPNETTGYVIFSINAEACLDEMVIENEAAIYFDGLSAIYTPFAKTEVIYDDLCLGTNISCEGDPTDDDGTEIPDPSSTNLVINNMGFKISPNPFSDIFSIQFVLSGYESSSTPTLNIYDEEGLVIADLSDKIIEGKSMQYLSIDASNWSNGIYFVKLGDTEDAKIWKIIKIQE